MTIKLLISEVRKVDDSVTPDVVAAAVFVNAGSRVEFGRVDIGCCSVAGSPHNDLAPAFRRTHLNPIDVLAIQARLAQSNHLSDDQIGSYRRFPRTVWCNRHWRTGFLREVFGMQRRRLSPENLKVQEVRTACRSGRLMITCEAMIKPPATAGGSDKKQRRRPPPKSAPSP